ncbi:MAG: putative transporter [Acidimicrobiales bacterium]|jgi:hypothetical protein|nr:putative transporter [Acidimicrobiales bacterium]
MVNVRKIGRPVLLVGSSWATAYLFDPALGRARRTQLRDRLAGRLRRLVRRAEKKAAYYEHRLEGLEAELHGAGRPHPVDDRAVADEVHRAIRACPFPTSDVKVDVVDGVATLRGQLAHPEEVREVRARAARAPGVTGVVSYLHLPGTLPPNKADAIKASHEHAPADNVVKH